MDNDKIEMRRLKMDFPFPGTLNGLGGDKDKSFPTMSEFFENRRKVKLILYKIVKYTHTHIYK